METSRKFTRDRELKASIQAQSWPTTPQSPLCETLGYFDSLPSKPSGDDAADSNGNDDDSDK